MGGGVGVAVALFDKGAINGQELAICIPAIYLMGSQVQYMGRCLGVIGIKGADMLQDHGCSSDHRHLLSLDHEHFRSRFIIRGLECQPDICLETQKFTHQNT